MASSPSTFPFSFPTTGPAYAPTAAFPPPPYGCGPPAYVPCSFLPAAAYPPTGFPGSHCPFPFPFYGVPPACPYSATYPYPPKATAYTPDTGFFPAPDPTPSTAAIHSDAPLCVPESHTPSTPRDGPVYQINQSSSVVHPANPEFKAQIGEMKESGSATVRHDCAPQSQKSGSNAHPSVASAPSPTLDPWAQQNGDLSSTKAASNNHTTASEFKISTRRPPVTSPPSPRGWASTLLKLPDAHPVLPDYTSQGGNITTSNGAGSASISDEKFIHKHTGPGTLPMVNASPNHDLLRDDDATVQAAADERIPAKNAIRRRRHRALLNLQARLDQQQARERNSFETIQDGLVKLTSMASQLTLALGMQTTKVLDETPTPRSGYESYTYGHPNPIQSSVHGESTNFSEQNLDGRPQPYGFHNLNRQSVFLADGTERSYFTLPADYPLERAVPEPVFAISDDESDSCSIGSVQVFGVYDDKSDGRSNEFDHVFTSTPEQHSYEEEQQDSEQLLKCVVKAPETEQTIAYLSYHIDVQQQHSVEKASVHVQQLGEPQSNVLAIHERRKEWDPGASAFLMTPLDDGSSNDPIGNEHVGHLVSSLGELSFHNIPPAKPPESEEFPAMQAIQSTCFLLEAIQSWQRGAFSLGNFARSALWRNLTLAGDKIFEDQHSLNSSMKKGTIFSSGRMLPWNPRYILLLHYFSWEFSMGMMLDKFAVPNLVYSDHTTFKQPIFVGQPVDLKQFWALISLLQSHSWYNTSTAFIQVHYCCLPVVLDCPYAETVMQLACCSRMVSSTVAILSAICMSSAITVRAIVVLRSGKIAQEGKDAAGLYQAFKIRLPMSNTSQIWDPGIEPILFVYKGCTCT